mgnify:CR=1 FL=1
MTQADPVRSLKLQDLQRALHACHRHSRQQNDLRRECLRRAQAWGRLANYAGSVILICLVLVLILQLFE